MFQEPNLIFESSLISIFFFIKKTLLNQFSNFQGLLIDIMQQNMKTGKRRRISKTISVLQCKFY